MTPGAIRKECLTLTPRERLRLCEFLRASLSQERKDIERGKRLLEYAATAIGVDAIDLKDRRDKMSWGRTMVAYQLINEGFTPSEAGRMIGKTHSTIIWMKNKMRTALEHPTMYWDLMPYWDKFEEILKNEETHNRPDEDTLGL